MAPPGARNKFGAPHVRTLNFSGGKCTVLKKVLSTLLGLSGTPVICHPGQCSPLSPSVRPCFHAFSTESLKCADTTNACDLTCFELGILLIVFCLTFTGKRQPINNSTVSYLSFLQVKFCFISYIFSFCVSKLCM